ncbi:hypothetical protein, partial [Weizmannia acidilactici]|uniref:hypothetical protein n=1 Tax=Weizmannia acidilactici TaxID=2607726 RepID=UPI001C12B6FF
MKKFFILALAIVYAAFPNRSAGRQRGILTANQSITILQNIRALSVSIITILRQAIRSKRKIYKKLKEDYLPRLKKYEAQLE